jgi:hypothetical protein
MKLTWGLRKITYLGEAPGHKLLRSMPLWEDLAEDPGPKVLVHDIGTEDAVYFRNFLPGRFGFHEAFQQEPVPSRRLSMQRLRHVPMLPSDSIRSPAPGPPTLPAILYLFSQAFSSGWNVPPWSKSI